MEHQADRFGSEKQVPIVSSRGPVQRLAPTPLILSDFVCLGERWHGPIFQSSSSVFFYQAFLPPVQLGHQLAGVGVGLDDNKAGRIVKAILAEIEVR